MSFIRTESIEIRKRNVASEKSDSADPPDYILIKEMTFQRTPSTYWSVGRQS